MVYPFPLVSGDAGTPEDARAEFAPYAARFVQSWQEHPVGGDAGLMVVFGGDNYTAEDQSLFPCAQQFAAYTGRGIDIGTTQFATKHYIGDFIIGCTSRIYFHRAGAAQRLIEARMKYGRGLYGAVGSYEACPVDPIAFRCPNPHLRTVWYGMDATDWKKYPFIINNRVEAHHFEAGKWNVTRWFLDRGLPVRMVTWGGEFEVHEFRHPKILNAFRRGDQTDMLVWDKHSDAWAKASAPIKLAWSKACGDK